MLTSRYFKRAFQMRPMDNYNLLIKPKRQPPQVNLNNYNVYLQEVWHKNDSLHEHCCIFEFLNFSFEITLLLTYIEFTQHWKHVLCKRLVTGKLNGINIWLNNIVIQIKTCLIFHNVHLFIMFWCRFLVKHLIFMKLLKKPAKENALIRSAVCLVLLDFWNVSFLRIFLMLWISLKKSNLKLQLNKKTFFSRQNKSLLHLGTFLNTCAHQLLGAYRCMSEVLWTTYQAGILEIISVFLLPFFFFRKSH